MPFFRSAMPSSTLSTPNQSALLVKTWAVSRSPWPYALDLTTAINFVAGPRIRRNSPTLWRSDVLEISTQVLGRLVISAGSDAFKAAVLAQYFGYGHGSIFFLIVLKDG